MARPKRDNNLAARLLVDAALLGEATACAKHKTTLRTLQKYRVAVMTPRLKAGACVWTPPQLRVPFQALSFGFSIRHIGGA